MDINQLIAQMTGGKQSAAQAPQRGPNVQRDVARQVMGDDAGDGYYDVGPQQIPPELLRLLVESGDTRSIAENLMALEPDDTGAIDFRDVGPQQVPPEMLKILADLDPTMVDSVIQTMAEVEGLERSPR